MGCRQPVWDASFSFWRFLYLLILLYPWHHRVARVTEWKGCFLYLTLAESQGWGPSSSGSTGGAFYMVTLSNKWTHVRTEANLELTLYWDNSQGGSFLLSVCRNSENCWEVKVVRKKVGKRGARELPAPSWWGQCCTAGSPGTWRGQREEPLLCSPVRLPFCLRRAWEPQAGEEGLGRPDWQWCLASLVFPEQVYCRQGTGFRW